MDETQWLVGCLLACLLGLEHLYSVQLAMIISFLQIPRNHLTDNANPKARGPSLSCTKCIF